jgi:CheY-like chemotaxis protein
MIRAVEKILVVDDEPLLRDIFSTVLTEAGYEVNTAVHGFDALLQMKRDMPDLLISDLNMPQMSGFELLSIVRRRFPKVCVIAASGAFSTSTQVPSGIIADAFFSKGEQASTAIVELSKRVLEGRGKYLNGHAKEPAPVWIPRNGRDSKGVPFIVLTCTECLRSFPLSVKEDNPTHEVRKMPCVFCGADVSYIIDFSVSVFSPPPGVVRP